MRWTAGTGAASSLNCPLLPPLFQHLFLAAEEVGVHSLSFRQASPKSRRASCSDGRRHNRATRKPSFLLQLGQMISGFLLQLSDQAEHWQVSFPGRHTQI